MEAILQRNEFWDSVHEGCRNLPTLFEKNVQGIMESEKTARQLLFGQLRLFNDAHGNAGNDDNTNVNKTGRIEKVIKKLFEKLFTVQNVLKRGLEAVDVEERSNDDAVNDVHSLDLTHSKRAVRNSNISTTFHDIEIIGAERPSNYPKKAPGAANFSDAKPQYGKSVSFIAPRAGPKANGAKSKDNSEPLRKKKTKNKAKPTRNGKINRSKIATQRCTE